MSAIVTRLRAVFHNDRSVELMNREAADEIERLRAERDEARRLICNIVSTACSRWSEDVAKDRGWEYLFKEDGK